MISNVRDQPHGASFKGWARKVSQEFKDRGVEVTTRHGYEIGYRYAWVCVGRNGRGDSDGKAGELSMCMGGGVDGEEEEGCGTQYQRHSKSIDVDRQRCGKCRGMLVQVRPKPRKTDSSKGRKGRFLKKGETNCEPGFERRGGSDGGVEKVVQKIGEIELVDLVDDENE
jgi:hypothetical protein